MNIISSDAGLKKYRIIFINYCDISKLNQMSNRVAQYEERKTSDPSISQFEGENYVISLKAATTGYALETEGY